MEVNLMTFRMEKSSFSLFFLPRSENALAYYLVVFRTLGNEAHIKETLILEGQKYNVSLCYENSQVSRYDSRLRVVLAKILCYLSWWTEEPEYHEVKNELAFSSVSQLMDGSVRISLVILELFDRTNVFSKVNQKLNDYNQMFGFSVGDKRGRQFGECQCHKTVDAGTLRSPSGSRRR